MYISPPPQPSRPQTGRTHHLLTKSLPTTEPPLFTETGKTAPLLTNSPQNQRPSEFISGSLTPHSPRDIGRIVPLLTNSTDRPFHRPGASHPLVSLFLKSTNKKPNTPHSRDVTPYFSTRPDPQKPHRRARKNFPLTPMERASSPVRSQNHRKPLPHKTIAATWHRRLSIDICTNRRTCPQLLRRK
jgi:hypothetical protein